MLAPRKRGFSRPLQVGCSVWFHHPFSSGRGSLFSLHLEPERSKLCDCQRRSVEGRNQVSCFPSFLGCESCQCFWQLPSFDLSVCVKHSRSAWAPPSPLIKQTIRVALVPKNQAWEHVFTRAPCESKTVCVCAHAVGLGRCCRRPPGRIH